MLLARPLAPVTQETDMSEEFEKRTAVPEPGGDPAERGRGDRRANDGGAPDDRSRSGASDAVNTADPLTGQATGAAGGYGTGSDVGSSGGSQERVDGTDSDVGPETEWLRNATGSRTSGRAGAGARDVTRDEGIATRGEDGLGATGLVAGERRA
jgi:hypothetical protein